MRKSTGMRTPPMAVQGVELHRHFRTEGTGTVEHSHAIGRREHEHLSQRLSRVLLTWADRGPSLGPVYEPDADPWYLEFAAIAFITLLFCAWVVLA